jgi:hypothetical protein
LNILKEEEDEDELVETANALPPTHKGTNGDDKLLRRVRFCFQSFIRRTPTEQFVIIGRWNDPGIRFEIIALMMLLLKKRRGFVVKHYF